MLRCKAQLQGKTPLAAMTCESTQPTGPTLNTTAQYGTFVLEFIQHFAAYNCGKGSTMIT